ncbi:MAG: rod shape-determining protein MreC [Candidatus Kapaibacteriota bacterium]
MQRLLEFLYRFKEYSALSALTIVSFIMMNLGNTTDLGGYRSIVVGGIGWMQSAFSWIPNPIALKNENAALRELNLQLSDERAKIRQSIIENAKLRKMLEFKKASTTPLITADIVGKTTTEARNYATINRGKKDGVEVGMPVVTDAGLVGLVVGTSDGYSVIRLLINRESRIAGKIQRSRIDGILIWDGEDALTMKNIPKSYDVQVGDEVITSSYSNRYPANIKIGTVMETRDDGTSLFRKILVKPSLNFLTLEQVFVMKLLPNPERILLERDNNKLGKPMIPQIKAR